MEDGEKIRVRKLPPFLSHSLISPARSLLCPTSSQLKINFSTCGLLTVLMMEEGSSPET
jgi:hypothetical protein